MNIQHITLSSLLLATTLSHATISGTVYQDLSNTHKHYGVKDSNEIGLKDITVTGYFNDPIQSKTTLTLSDGSFTLDINTTARIEFSNWPNYLQPSPKNTDNNSSVQFAAKDKQNINFALYNLNDYTGSNTPAYVTNLISNGNGNNSSIPSLVYNNYQDQGLNADFNDTDGQAGTGQTYGVTAKASTVGAIWGKGYQVSKKRLFAASVLWRHSGFTDNTASKILVADYTILPGSIIGSFNLQGINGIDLGAVTRTGNRNFALEGDASLPNIDLDAYAKIGKISYGDLDFDNNNETIWTINLNQRALISLDASKDINNISSTAKQYILSSLTGVPSCTGGILRPWALGINQDKGYIGAVCDASTSQNVNDLKSYVLEFDLENPSLGLTTVLSINMNYDRKSNADGVMADITFFPWSDSLQPANSNWNYYNQPILTDIEFDKDNNMYLAFSDRFALQTGYKNYTPENNSTSTTEQAQGWGEIFKVCNIAGNFELEGTGSCPAGTSRNGDIDFFDEKGGDFNANPIGGALAIVSGSNQILATINDPHPSGNYGREYWSTNGVQTFSTQSGEIENWYSHLYSAKIEYTGKGVGLGDIELLSDTPPLEIGDRIWLDSNADGIQDPSENGISNITIELFKGSSKLASATTDTHGYYLFSSASAISTSSNIYNITQLTNDNNYTLRVPNINGSIQQSSLNNLANSVSILSGGTSLHDNNAIEVNNDANVSILASSIQAIGTSNHSFDIGLKPQVAVLGTTVCQDMTVNDDTQNANSTIAITTINILANDIGSKAGQEIKFLSLIEGETLWESNSQTVTPTTTFNSLLVIGEGTWSVLNNEVIFTALNSFDGQIPTPVYYIIEGIDCTDATKYSNVAKITINTPCTCPTYTTRSVTAFNFLSLLILVLLTYLVVFRNKIKY